MRACMAALCLSLASFVPGVAHSANLPVSYDVNYKVLKSTASASTLLTFTLYSDAACTTSVASSQVAIENVDLVSRLKRLTLKGTPKPAPPAVCELQYVMQGVTTSGNLYLEVTGTGVTPVGPACQPQAAAVTGGTKVILKDAAGTVLGELVATNTVQRTVGGELINYPLDLNPMDPMAPFPSYTFLNFTSTDCSGTALLTAGNIPGNAEYFSSTAYGSPLEGAMTTWNSFLQTNGNTYLSQADCDAYFTGVPYSTFFVPPNGCCGITSGSDYLGAAVTESLPTVVFPIHFEYQ